MAAGGTNVAVAVPAGAGEPTCFIRRSVAEMFGDAVAAHPDRVAVAGDDRSLTYRELAASVKTAASRLNAAGVAPDDCVGVFVEPSAELVVAVWSVVCAGGGYVPLSPDYPDERLRYMLHDARPRVVLTQRSLRARLAAIAPPGIEVVCVEEITRTTGPVPARQWAAPRPEHLAYVIYTSGSTGVPKGVMVEHGAVANQLGWLHDVHGLGPGSVVLQKTPLSFDAAQWEVLAPACGATVVAGTPGLHRDPDRLVDTIVRHRVTTLQCVPTLLRALVDGGRATECTSLRQIGSGGETLTRSLADECLREVPWAELVNLYGPTECTINASAHVVSREELLDGPPAVPLGIPAHGTYFRVLDERCAPVSPGEIGELFIGGRQLARGYLGRPDLTAQRFVPDPFTPEPARLFRSGDLVRADADGTVHFVGRADNQVKLRGFRVELDEIRLAIEAHDWIRTAAVLVKPDARTGFENLVACIELDPRQAFLMDQGNHGAHHQSKASRLQVRAQLSNPGLRPQADLAGLPRVALPGREPTAAQRREVFARKTYRFYDGGEVTAADLLDVLNRRPAGSGSLRPEDVDAGTLGEVLRWFGQFHSGERLLPKYGYAAPGALYAVQLYLEVRGVAGLAAGHYYYHPVDHELVLVRPLAQAGPARLLVHCVGRRSVVEPVYRNNVDEVLEIETGHLAGLFEEILPRHGLGLRALGLTAGIEDALGCAPDDHHTATFEIVAWQGGEPDLADLYVQVHPGGVADLSAGQYRHTGGELRRIADDLVLRRDVIAINQEVYDRARFGVTVIARADEPWRRYVDLGRVMQRISMNDAHLGFMSSGYSSASGNPLPSALKIDAVLRRCELPTGPSYFFVGGRISPEQRASEGMREDAVHMRGPAEIVRDDLAELLPDYMVPNKVVVFDALPVTANGKVDLRALLDSERTDAGPGDRPLTAPRTAAERRVAAAWSAALRCDDVSVHDDFFVLGGNSLIAVTLINRLNKEFGTAVPLQTLFEAPTVAGLAERFERGGAQAALRLIPLRPQGSAEPVFCWPGLGGYPMNLRPLARELGLDRPFYGVQARGVNPGETAHDSVAAAAAEDVAEIRARQPHGPYTLWGYSFGARLAFEAAHQLEQAGERVENLVLLAPGAPVVVLDGVPTTAVEGDYRDPAFVAILLSVFTGRIDHPCLPECLRTVHDDAGFAAFVARRFDLDAELVGRITAVVRSTFEPEYTFAELRGRRLGAPVTIVKARGDDYSFLESHNGFTRRPPVVLRLNADHYSMLDHPDLAELVGVLRPLFDDRPQETAMPHINIKHFPVELTEDRQRLLVAALTAAVREAFHCDEDVISIALEPVDQDVWNDRVYLPEIVNRKDLLCKVPQY
ncbi:amino acid adenylation domain-containing protein [Lentzea sp. NEAU-D7]|uniref:amino acid adenylation domain-containing protein n=1 Tax=Lentzea sp. NEAU-D7 TaxID=2994667 RepID=UPI00224ABDCB|nr:amino acid adenylation domain-containing protein [Lentzea sp. NEAU-D7]MCX2952793.1 amino acid adenylation domain-containing protein [Lentzea sp. NEAU-D7]